MKEEIQTACKFIHHMLRRSCKLQEQQLQEFSNKMQDVLFAHFRHHWHLDNPQLGSAYRCIRINQHMDPLVKKAADECGLRISDLALPKEFTLWIDPNEISYRFGEDGSINTVPMTDNKSDGGNLESTLLNRSKSQPCALKGRKVTTMNTNIHSLPECVST